MARKNKELRIIVKMESGRTIIATATMANRSYREVSNTPDEDTWAHDEVSGIWHDFYGQRQDWVKRGVNKACAAQVWLVSEIVELWHERVDKHGLIQNRLELVFAKDGLLRSVSYGMTPVSPSGEKQDRQMLAHW